MDGSRVPILCLTSRSDEIDTVLGLELGADDYVAKPFGTRELVARVKALLRRTKRVDPTADGLDASQLDFGPLRIDAVGRRVTVDGEMIRLSRTEFDILLLLAGQPGRVVTRELILETVLGYSTDNHDASLTTHMHRLRSKLEGRAGTVYIQTIRGVGYRFSTEAVLPGGSEGE